MGPSSSSCSCLRLKLGQGKTTNLESPGNAESFIQGRCGCGAQSHRLGPILLGMSLAVCGVWHSLELGSALSGWRADCHEGFPTIEVGKTSQVPPSGAGSICWRMQVVPERRGRILVGQPDLPHPINTTGLCLHPPAPGKTPSLRLSALVLAGASTGTRLGLQGRAEDGWQMEKWAQVEAAPAMGRLQRAEDCSHPQ